MTLDKRLNELTLDDIQRLVDDCIPESRTLEYKENLNLSTEDGRIRALRHVTAFANAQGGHLILGVLEKRDDQGGKTGVPDRIVGVTTSAIDEYISPLVNLLHDGVDPPLWGVEHNPIPVDEKSYVIVFQIPRSLAAPHAVRIGGGDRFFARTTNGKQPLDVASLRRAFLEPHSVREAFQSFRERRLALVTSGRSPLPKTQPPVILLHIAPLASFHLQTRRVSAARLSDTRISPLAHMGENHRFNADGLLRYWETDIGGAYVSSYVQLFTNGRIEFVDSYFSSGNVNNGRGSSVAALYGEELSMALLQRAEAGIRVLTEMDYDPPYALAISLAGASGRLFASGGGYPVCPKWIQGDSVHTPEEICVDRDVDICELMRPLLDTLWNAAGHARCEFYDANGRWKLPKRPAEMT